MKVATEFVGTFLFLFTISLAAVSGSALAPLAIGCTLMVMVYMGGHRSGGHYNPAVSFGLFLSKKLDAKDLAPYVIAQTAAGILAFMLGCFITGKTVTIGPGVGFNVLKALIVEVIFTFALVLVVLNVACSKKTEGNDFYGLAIGFTIVIGAIAGGSISGGAYNPAVGIGATVSNALFGGGTWSNIWIPILGPLLGAAGASFLWKAQESAETLALPLPDTGQADAWRETALSPVGLVPTLVLGSVEPPRPGKSRANSESGEHDRLAS
jgi:aquaporin Z